MRKLLSASLCVLAGCISALAAAQERSVEDYIAAVEGTQSEPGANGLGDLTLEALMARFNVPGVSLAVIHDFEIHWAKGYGVADVVTDQPVDTATLFQAASISKPVAAMGVLKAVQDDVFGLDDDINDILTSWQLEGGEFTRERPVTPRSLTSHTSGLGDGFGFPGYDPGGAIPTVIQILDGEPPSNTRPLFMERPPFSLTEYSGGGATLMQQALADARGRPFEQVLRDDVLAPIGMADSTFEQPLPSDRDRNAARAHDGEGRSRGPKWHVYPEMAAAGLWTTAGDLARFAIEVQKSALGESNKVLSRAMVQEMLTPVGVGDYAVGFSLQKMGQGWYFSHGGSNWGFQSTLLAHKLHGYGLAIMTNADRGGAVMQELSQRIQRAYEWDSLAPPAPRGYDPPPDYETIELSPDVLDDYVGDYQLNEQVTLAITLEDDTLMAAPTGQPSAQLFAVESDHFFLRVAPVEVLFTRDGDGEVVSLTVVQGGQRTEAPRLP